MRMLILAATEKELESCRNHFQKEEREGSIKFCTIGVGAISATFYTQLYINRYRPDLVILGGIAGSFDKEITLGETFVIASEVQATTGVAEGGKWIDVFDLGFANRDEFPYENGVLENPFLEKFTASGWSAVAGISVDEITTHPQRQKQYLDKYHPILESMEGAAFHFVCLHIGVPFLQIRSVSNYVGERDKTKWNFAKAFQNLNESITKLIAKFKNDN